MLDMKTGGKRPRHHTLYSRWGGELMIFEIHSPTVSHIAQTLPDSCHLALAVLEYYLPFQ